MNAPKELTTPPEGYEWTGEIRIPRDEEPHGYFDNNKWKVGSVSAAIYPRPILRKIKPPTVMVEMERRLAEYWAISTASGVWGIQPTKEACREALAKEKDEE